MKRRMMVLAAMAAVVMAVAVACNPQFLGEGSLTATDEAPYVALNWPAATAMHDGEPIIEYAIEVDGVEVSRVDGWVTSCTLKGLSNATTYTIGVTAYDAGGRFSGDATQNGRLTVVHTTQSSGDSGGAVFCEQATGSTTTTTISGD